MFYGSCTTCVGTNTNECSLATCSDGYMTYSNGACTKIDCSTIDFGNVLSVVDGLCTYDMCWLLNCSQLKTTQMFYMEIYTWKLYVIP